jgi:hypothetical protein
MKLWQIGLILFIAGGIVNAVLINLEIGGLIRELARLLILSHIVIFVVGLTRRKN